MRTALRKMAVLLWQRRKDTEYRTEYGALCAAMAMLLTQSDGTVTTCHSRTENLAEITREADILVSAIGKTRFVTADMVKEGAVVIDVAMNRDENGKLCGDVDFAGVEPKASYITPVPGGVGPMTRALLMKNILTAAKNHQV